MFDMSSLSIQLFSRWLFPPPLNSTKFVSGDIYAELQEHKYSVYQSTLITRVGLGGWGARSNERGSSEEK